VDDDTSAPRPGQRPRREKSLATRALGHLARREHSRAELARKLAPHAGSAAELERLLDDLQARRLLSDRRFAEVLVRSRGDRFGAVRVRQELAARGVGAALAREAVGPLAHSEFERAKAVWQRKFGAAAADLHERARQMRFLARRGFAADVIRRVVGLRDDG
jgi:regulatory protein